MIKLTEYQKYVIGKFKVHDKMILLWFRQSGKGQVMLETITDFVLNNSDKTILFFNYTLGYSILFTDRIVRGTPKLVLKATKKEIKFINNNRLIFCSLHQNDLSSYFSYNPSLVFFDVHFSSRKNEIENLAYIKLKMNTMKNCKWMFACSMIYLDFFELIDNNDACYINILSYEMLYNSTTPSGYEYLEGEYHYGYDIFRHKRPEMLEFMNKNMMRKLKLRKLKEISSGS